MKKKDEYNEWLTEKLASVYKIAWTDGKRAMYPIDSEEYNYLRDLCVKNATE